MKNPQASRHRYEQIFQQAYARLNPEQRQAVDHIDGPVMVIAGPGTGKTQILAVRIGKILLEMDTQAHNILCLTYTDAATIAMRNRLVEIIGPDAHRVNIFTFHGFCNQVIQEHQGYFGEFRQLEPISELEQIDLFKKLINDLPNDHILKRLKSDSNYESRRLRQLFSLMKSENYKVDDILRATQEHLTELQSTKSMFYMRSGKGYQKGDFKQKKYDEVFRKMQELDAGAGIYPIYKNEMRRIGRYDYDDMITWVIQAFEEDADLLAEYQERYHYFLVDEFQDTNGAQKRILDLLISYWEDPNVFVVGDDDQAIYKFQGANLDNIRNFNKQYHPTPVVLASNYRSSQKILDAAKTLIEHNKERIINEPDFPLSKDIFAAGDYKSIPAEVIISCYPNLTHEQADIAKQLLQWHDEEKDLSKIAILYRKHKQVEKLVEVLEKQGVPLNIKKKVDILQLPLVRNILTILRYVNDKYTSKAGTDRLLFEILHYNFLEVHPSDITQMMWHLSGGRNEESESFAGGLSKLITRTQELEKLDLINAYKISHVSDLLGKWIADINDVTLQILFQNVINEGQILAYVLQHPGKSWLLQVLSTLFDMIKEESGKNPAMKLGDLLHTIELMEEHNLPLQINKVVQSTNGVHFTTAHSAKGMEYEHVIVIGCSQKVWDRPRGSWGQFSYPPSLNGDVKTNQEDERRLMYVAMTRAEKLLQLSYSLQEENGKELGVSQFVDEVRLKTPVNYVKKEVTTEIVNTFQEYILKKAVTPVELIDHDLIDKRLRGYELSVTHLNKYLKCPITYYFEVILRVPMARTKYLGFGRAVHRGLEMMYNSINEGQEVDRQILITEFEKSMQYYRSHFTERQFVDMKAYGQQVLEAYYQKYGSQIATNIRYDLEASIDHVEYKGIPIKGILDCVAIHRDHVVVTDFKTGNYANNKSKLYGPNDQNEKGGDYWRQMVFYKILCDIDAKRNWNMRSGYMDFIEPDRKTGAFFKKAFEIYPNEIELVGEQIQSTWENIHNHEFKKGCGEDDCYWCDFVQNDYVMDFSWQNEEANVE